MRKQVSSLPLWSGITGLCLGALLLLGAGTGSAQVIEFLPVAPSMMESGGAAGTNIAVIVTLTPALTNGAGSVDFVTSDLTAVSGTDYLSTSGTLSFGADQNFATVTVPIIDNSLPQPTRQFLITLSNPQGVTLGANSTIEVTIFDNDAVYLYDPPTTVFINENATNLILTVRRNGGYGPGSVQYYTEDGNSTNTALNAINGINYIGGPGIIEFTNSQDTAQIIIPIIDDFVIETNNLTFYVTLTNAIGGTIGAQSAATINIVNTDTKGGQIQFTGRVDPIGTNVPENVGTITLWVNRIAGSDPVSVNWQILYDHSSCPGSPMAQASDFTTALSGTVNWVANDSAAQPITIGINDDNYVELDESFVVVLSNPTGGATLGRLSSMPITILFDDQPAGAADRTYNPLGNLNPTPGANDSVQALAVYTNGKFAGQTVIGGSFSSVNSTVRYGVARLTGTGALDGTFNPGSGADGFVSAVAIQPDDKVLVAGGFSSMNNISRQRIARLNPDGSLDTTFNPGAGTDQPIYDMALQSDGKVVIVGDFSTVRNEPRNRVARLNADGTVDLTFNPGLGPNDLVWKVALQQDGRVLVGGYFTTFSTTNLHYVARLNVDGSVDSTFVPIAGANGPVFALVQDSSLGIIIGGAFTMYDGVPAASVARLTPLGIIDQTWGACQAFDGPVYYLALQADGKVLAAGDFTAYNSIPRARLARLYNDGTLDTSFLDKYYNQTQPGMDGTVTAVGLQADGNIMIGGSFSQIGGGYTATEVLPRLNFARIIGGVNPPDANFPGNVQFVQAQYSVDENSLLGAINLTVQRTFGNVGSVTVDYATSDGTALAGRDYLATTGSITFAGCSLGTRLISIPILNNNIADGNRTFGFTLSDPRGSLSNSFPALGGQCTAAITIIDDDFAHGALGFSAPVYNAGEGDGDASITVWRTNGVNGQISVQYATSNGSAANQTDYLTTSGTLTFAAGETNKSFKVRMLDNTAVQPERTVNLRLYNPSGGATLGLSNATLLIFDNDGGAGSISFSNLTYRVGEADGTATIALRRTSGSAGLVSATFVTTSYPPGQGAATPWADYTPVTNAVYFSNGVVSQTVSVPVVDDLLVEGNETLQLQLVNPTGGATLGFISNADLTIIDNDFYGNLTFSAGQYYISELASFITVTVNRVGGSAQEVSVDYATVPGTAVDGVNYIGTSGRLTLTNGETSKSFVVTVLHNPALEGNLTVQLLLSNFAKGGPGQFTNATLTIVDAEALHQPAGSVDTFFDPEPGPNNYVDAVAIQQDGKLVIAGEFTSVNNIGLNRIARLNTEGTLDSAFIPGTGVNDAVYSVALQADQRILIGGLFAQVGGTNRSGVARLTQVGLLDLSFNPGAGVDNPVYKVLALPDGNILLGGAFSTFNGVSRRGVARLHPDGSADLSFHPGVGANGTVYALAQQEDKYIVGGSFTLFNNQLLTNLARLNSDGALDSTFHAAFDGVVRAVTVQPDDKVLVAGEFTKINGVARARLGRLNADGSLDLTFDPGTGADAVVNAVALQLDGRILAAGSFTNFNGWSRGRIARLTTNGVVDTSIDFGAGANDFIRDLAIQNDGMIVIAGAFTNFDGVTRRHVARLVGGLDQGPGLVSFESSQYVVSEGDGSLSVNVMRRNGSYGTVEVDAYTQDDTALAGGRYQAVTQHLVFTNGETYKKLTIPLIDDLLIEPPQDFRLFLANPIGTALGTIPTAVVTILDNDSRVDFVSTNFYVNKNVVGGLALIGLQRSGSTNTAVTVDFATVRLTAVPNYNYQPTNGTILFAPGATTQIMAVQILQNNVAEGPLTVGLSLRNPQVLTNLTAGVYLGQSNALLTIIDNNYGPGTIAFATNSYVVSESAGQVALKLVRTGGARGAVSVVIATQDGSARDAIDYTGLNGLVSFPDGVTNETVNIPVINNTIPDGSRSFSVGLSSPQNGVALGFLTNIVVTITDDDFAAGTTDPTFDPGTGANDLVRSLLLQPDGRVVLAGAFTNVNGLPRNYVARLLSSGAVDPSFRTTNKLDSMVTCLAWDPASNIVIGGVFTNYGASSKVGLSVKIGNAFTNIGGYTNPGITLSRVARLNYDGTRDTNFQQVSLLNGQVNAVAVQPDRKVVFGGALSQPVSGVGRFRADGSLDASFAPGQGTDGIVNALNLLPDGQLYLAGAFSTFNLFPSVRVARVTENASFDQDFQATNQMDGWIYAQALQPDGKLLVGGDFTRVGTANRRRLARLNPDGSLDTTFRIGTGANSTVYAVALQPDGKILVGGDFTTFNGTNLVRYARLNSDGSVDGSFQPGRGADNTVYAILVLPDGDIVLGGAFTSVNGYARNGVCKVFGSLRPPVFQSIQIQAPDVLFQVLCMPAWSYVLQQSADLKDWQPVSTNTALGSTLFLSAPIPPGSNYLFYRVQMQH